MIFRIGPLKNSKVYQSACHTQKGKSSKHCAKRKYYKDCLEHQRDRRLKVTWTQQDRPHQPLEINQRGRQISSSTNLPDLKQTRIIMTPTTQKPMDFKQRIATQFEVSTSTLATSTVSEIQVRSIVRPSTSGLRS